MKIGIVGGGQLGRMLVQSGIPMGHTFTVLDPTPNCPAFLVGADQIDGAYDDLAGTRKLVRTSDVITFEIERYNPILLDKSYLHNAKVLVRPMVQVLQVIVDKVIQKTFLRGHHLPVGPFHALNSPEDAKQMATVFGYPFMLKIRKDGFDGRGNAKINSEEEIAPAWEKLTELFGNPTFYMEQYVPFTKELAVITVRDVHGNIVTYPTVQTVHENNICDLVMSPAPIDRRIDTAAQELARKTAAEIGAVGVLAVEMFLVENDDGTFVLFINELAPRVHNSGHCTIDGFDVSQFVNHIRAVTGQTILQPRRKLPVVVMKNILGRLGDNEGDIPFPWPGLEEAAKLPVVINTYGKASRIDRKIGHINVVGFDLDFCCEIGETARELIKV